MANSPIDPLADIPAGESAAHEGANHAGDGATLRDQAASFARQAAERARTLGEEGKDRAADAIGEVSRMMGSAADTVDERLGEQYGKYARSAAEGLADFSDTLKDKDFDDLVDDAREFVRKSPAVAIGVAAALGFALARLLRAGGDRPGRGGDDANGA